MSDQADRVVEWFRDQVSNLPSDREQAATHQVRELQKLVEELAPKLNAVADELSLGLKFSTSTERGGQVVAGTRIPAEPAAVLPYPQRTSKPRSCNFGVLGVASCTSRFT
jgi:hypothetical protein